MRARNAPLVSDFAAPPMPHAKTLLTEMPNGVRVIALPMPHLHTAAVSVFANFCFRGQYSIYFNYSSFTTRQVSKFRFIQFFKRWKFVCKIGKIKVKILKNPFNCQVFWNITLLRQIFDVFW